MAPKPKETRLTRALKQRFFYISHRHLSSESNKTQGARFAFLITGSSGNIYTVNIPEASKRKSAIPSCNCIDQRIRKTVCKHMLFVLLRVLKLPLSELEGDEGDQSEETISTSVKSYPILKKLYEMATNLPPRGALNETDPAAAPQAVRNAAQIFIGDTANPINNKIKQVAQKPIQEDDECPICFETFDEEDLLYCKFSCGNSVHKECFEKYAQAVSADDQHVRCVLCRSIWNPRQAMTEAQAQIGRRGLLQRGKLVNLGEIIPDEFEYDQFGRRRIPEQDVEEEEYEEEYESDEYKPEEEVVDSGSTKGGSSSRRKGNTSTKRRKIDQQMSTRKQKKEEDIVINTNETRNSKNKETKKEEEIEDIKNDTKSVGTGSRRSARLAEKKRMKLEDEDSKTASKTIRSGRKRTRSKQIVH